MTTNLMTRSLSLLLLAPALTAQYPPPSLGVFGSPSGQVFSMHWDLGSAPGSNPFALLGDAGLQPIRYLDELVWVGPSATQLVVTAGITRGPVASGQINVPLIAPFLGMSLWLQALVADPNYQNAVFAASNVVGQPIHNEPGAVRISLIQPAFHGWTGNFDRGQNTRLQGAPVRHRTKRTVDPQGIPFGFPLASPFHHYGLREQMVFRPEDVGATGEEELLVGVAWRPLLAPIAETFDAFEMLAAHTDVRPDFSIDPWSGLPAFEHSGLRPTFAQNYLGGVAPQSMFAGRYDVRPQDRRPDGYMSYPLSQPFAYDGVSSLLLEYRLMAAPQRGAALNGQSVRLMVLSSPLPAARMVARGDDPQHLVDPGTVTDGFGDNTMHDMLLDFVRVKSVATSPWFATGFTDWQPPAVAAHIPPGASIAFEFRGGQDLNGTGATAWSPTVDIADGFVALQMRITFIANAATDQAPFIAGLEVIAR